MITVAILQGYIPMLVLQHLVTVIWLSLNNCCKSVTHIHIRMHARTHAHTHVRTHRTHALTHACTARTHSLTHNNHDVNVGLTQACCFRGVREREREQERERDGGKERGGVWGRGVGGERGWAGGRVSWGRYVLHIFSYSMSSCRPCLFWITWFTTLRLRLYISCN